MGSYLSYAGENPEPELGDLIEIFRTGPNQIPYRHWAVYVGHGFVVHFGLDPGGSSRDKAPSGIVQKEKLLDVVGKDDWKINNSMDRQYKPRPANVIVEDAEAKEGQQLQYDLVSFNCEHFVKELRYGVAESQQVQTAAVGVGAGLLGGLALSSMASRAGPNTL